MAPARASLPLLMAKMTLGWAIDSDIPTGVHLEIVLLVMTKKSLEFLLKSSAKLGGDIGVSVGPVGAGAKAQTSDILAYSRSKGLYGRIDIEF